MSSDRLHGPTVPMGVSTAMWGDVSPCPLPPIGQSAPRAECRPRHIRVPSLGEAFAQGTESVCHRAGALEDPCLNTNCLQWRFCLFIT